MLTKTRLLLLAYCLKFALVIGLLWIPAFAAIDVYQFNNDAERDRFHTLTTELRCPKCQNQNIADSNAPIAQDLRAKIHTMIGEQRSDQEIVDYMIARYGDFVLYQPRMNSTTYILWFGPILLLLLGIAIVIFISRRNSAKISLTETSSPELDTLEQKKLAALLNDTGKKSS